MSSSGCARKENWACRLNGCLGLAEAESRAQKEGHKAQQLFVCPVRVQSIVTLCMTAILGRSQGGPAPCHPETPPSAAKALTVRGWTPSNKRSRASEHN
jgi:hypothetical protein